MKWTRLPGSPIPPWLRYPALTPGVSSHPDKEGRAVDAGVIAISVSNHGGNNLLGETSCV
ncbi:hypothetical protein FDZ84_29640 [Saccharopolyspora sp. ASAGF58]|nr:hypothetical protein FDZ84_29640 [Saccharopolyspora sp. ASAGF58]